MGSGINDIARGISDNINKSEGWLDKTTGTKLGTNMDYWFAPVGITKAGMDLIAGAPPPQAPGTDPTLESLKQQQLANARNFRQNMPAMSEQMGNQLKSASQQNLRQNIGYTKDYNNKRGLLYGGMEQGMEGRQRAQSASGLASGISGINTGLLNAANTLDTQAIQTGVGIQQTQQAIQNQLYSQAMAQQAGQNSLMGNVASTGLLLALLA